MIRTVLFFAALAGAAPALAADRKPVAPSARAAKPARPAKIDRVAAEFAATDVNHDGVLERPEVDARVARMHLASGKVAPADLKALGDVWFARADTNRDGRITRGEMNALLTATAARYDTNHDGVVSVAERSAARAAAIAETRAAPRR